tara:strand:- start:245 stop:769 length:525 start_codon:yes stop_codon:yes gene_type:complete
MSEFQNVVSYYSKAYVSSSGSIDQDIQSAGADVNMILSPDAGATDVTTLANSNTIQGNLNGGNFVLQEVGFYLFQFVFTFSGAASNNYIVTAFKNEVEIDASQVKFTTRGSGVKWEVAMTFLVDAGYNEYEQPAAQLNKGLMRSTNTIQFKCQNSGGAGDLTIDNGIYNILKIN